MLVSRRLTLFEKREGTSIPHKVFREKGFSESFHHSNEWKTKPISSTHSRKRTNEQIGNSHSIPLEILMTDLPKGTIIRIESCLGVSRTFGTDNIQTDNFTSFYCCFQMTFYLNGVTRFPQFSVIAIELTFVSRFGFKYAEGEHVLHDFRLCKRVFSTFLWAVTDWNKCVKAKGSLFTTAIKKDQNSEGISGEIVLQILLLSCPCKN